MTEPDNVEFHERIGRTDEDRSGSRFTRSIPVRIGIVAGSAILFVVGAVAAMGASPAPSGSTAAPVVPGGVAPEGVAPGMPFDGTGPMFGKPGGFGFEFRGGGARVGGPGAITIGEIHGSDLSLKTDDGWTRTIAVGSSTTITKGGQTIAVGDLRVGDQIVFGESKASDGSYTITAIRVVLPVVGGQVTAVGSDSITVDQKGGGSATIHVDASTTYDVNGNGSAKLADVTVGSFVVAEGSLRSDGSLDASAVHAGIRGGRGGGGMGPMFRGGPNDYDQDHPNAKPNATPTTPSSAS